MISPTGDFETFIRHAIKNELKPKAICVLARLEKSDAIPRIKGNYVERLNGLCGLLENGKRGSVDEVGHRMMRPLIESMVSRGEMKPTAMTVFTGDHRLGSS